VNEYVYGAGTASASESPPTAVNVKTRGSCHKKGMRFIGYIVNAFDPCFPFRKFILDASLPRLYAIASGNGLFVRKC